MRGLLLGFSVLFYGCANTDDGGSDRVAAKIERPSSVTAGRSFLRVLDSTVLDEPSEHPIVAPSGMAVLSNGDLLIADASEGLLHRYSRDGRFAGVIGRRGDGPGEFRTPAYPFAGEDGSIYVVDLAKSQVVVFERDYSFKRTITFPAVSRIDQVAIDRANRFWVLGNARDSKDDRVLTVADSNGKAISAFLPIARLLPHGSTDSLLWASSRRPSIAVGDSLVYVVSSLVDSIWTIEQTSLRLSARSLGHPMYRDPVPPTAQVQSRTDHRRWLESNILIANVASVANFAIVGYSAGLYLNQSNTLASLVAGDRIVYLDSVPPIITSTSEAFVQLATDGSGRHTLFRFSPVGR